VFGPVSFSTAGGHPTARAEAGGKQQWPAFDDDDDDDNGGGGDDDEDEGRPLTTYEND
jgi:hypothetical protein